MPVSQKNKKHLRLSPMSDLIKAKGEEQRGGRRKREKRGKNVVLYSRVLPTEKKKESEGTPISTLTLQAGPKIVMSSPKRGAKEREGVEEKKKRGGEGKRSLPTLTKPRIRLRPDRGGKGEGEKKKK